MKRMDGISFPRAFWLSKEQDGSVGLVYRRQMGDVDSSNKAVPWLPLSGPIEVLNKKDLDKERLRSVPKKPIMVEGLKSAIELYSRHDVISKAHQLVSLLIYDLYDQ